MTAFCIVLNPMLRAPEIFEYFLYCDMINYTLVYTFLEGFLDIVFE